MISVVFEYLASSRDSVLEACKDGVCISGRLPSDGGEPLGIMLSTERDIFRGTIARSIRRSGSKPDGASCIGQAKNWS
jgi:hypothetical protein